MVCSLLVLHCFEGQLQRGGGARTWISRFCPTESHRKTSARHHEPPQRAPQTPLRPPIRPQDAQRGFGMPPRSPRGASQETPTSLEESASLLAPPFLVPRRIRPLSLSEESQVPPALRAHGVSGSLLFQPPFSPFGEEFASPSAPSPGSGGGPRGVRFSLFCQKCFQDGFRRPRQPSRWLKIAQHGSTLPPTCLQEAPGPPPEGSACPRGLSRTPPRHPICPQQTNNVFCPLTASPSMGNRSLKMDPQWPNINPRGAQGNPVAAPAGAPERAPGTPQEAPRGDVSASDGEPLIRDPIC